MSSELTIVMNLIKEIDRMLTTTLCHSPEWRDVAERQHWVIAVSFLMVQILTDTVIAFILHEDQLDWYTFPPYKIKNNYGTL